MADFPNQTPSQFRSVTEQEPLYSLWRGEPLSRVELAMLALIIKHWRAGTPIERDVAEFELVQAGFPYKEVQPSRYALNARSPRAITIEQNDKFAAPKLAGLIELGDVECVADLKLLAHIVETLRTSYRPDRRQISLEEVCSSSDVTPADVLRLAPLTELSGNDGTFQLDGHVLGWTSFTEFLNDRMGTIPDAEVRAVPGVAELKIDFIPSRLSWANLGPFAETTLELSPMTVLVGGNGVGKTSALRVFELLRHVAVRGIAALNPEHSSADLVREGAAEISLTVGGALHKHGLKWMDARWTASITTRPHRAARSEALHVADDRPAALLEFGVGWWMETGHSPEPFHLRPIQLALLEARSPQKYGALVAVRQGLTRWRAETDETLLAHPYFDLDQRRAARMPPMDVKALQEAASAVLGPLELKQTIFNQISFVDPRGRNIPLRDAPRGIGQVVAVLTHLMQPDPPQLLAIDEIENHLHANVLERLLEVMRGFTHRTRIVLATHSSTVLRSMAPDEVRVVRAEGETSTIVRADQDPRLSQLMETGELGALLDQGYFAGGL